MRGRVRAAREVQHEHDLRDQLDGRAGLQAEEPRRAGGREGQGGLGEACGEYTPLRPKICAIIVLVAVGKSKF